MISRTIRGAALALALVATPATAFAIGISSGDGSGEQHVTQRFNNGAKVSGTIKSAKGSKVYYRGLVDWGKWQCSNTDIGRYTPMVTSKKAVTTGGTISGGFPGPICGGNVKPKASICRDINLLPDACSAWSARF
ncbi:hypothetical protein [Arsenicicoccus dermatophilus]|uniref:hypothetical protein n=1 Tax=Arsenicicoccus dermatophilus TaxID=1076331 RepID=UPI003916E7AB